MQHPIQAAGVTRTLTGSLCLYAHRCGFLATLAIRSPPHYSTLSASRSVATIGHCVGLLPSPMGLCLSVALWKEKVRAARRGHDVVVNEVLMGGGGGGGCSDYGLLRGGVLEAEEAVEPRAAGVERAAAASGTPARPIWQRRVLMGVKCQLPRFSGMILYDERGRPVCGGIRDRARDQEKHAAAISVLRDMLQ